MASIRPAALLAVLLLACTHQKEEAMRSSNHPQPTPTEPKSAVTAERIHDLTRELIEKHGREIEPRLTRGLRQVAELWREEDGDYAAFVREHFIVDELQRAQSLERFRAMLEAIDGHMNEIGRELRRPTDLDLGPLLPADPLFAAFDPSAHLSEDMFASKLAFAVLLNFPLTSLEERIEQGKRWSREEWAAARLAGRFSRRIPGEVQQEIARAGADASLYIDQYNIWMHHLVDDRGARLFPKGLRLISHWNLRDELKADYADREGKGLEKQRMIVKVMERIVTQTIPRAVIDNPRLDWNPYTNAVSACPPTEIEDDAPPSDRPPSADPEPDTRYQKLLAHFRAAKKADPHSPIAPTALARSYDLEREIPEDRVKAMFTEVLESPLVPKIAALIEARLGRKLEPQDLWYNGFQARGRFSEAELDAITKKRYPTKDAFAADIPRILTKLGFAKARVEHLASHIEVDASRGAGHAMPSLRRGDFPRLRTRVEKDGMNYKGYNIAVHELGHNVEQVFSLYDVDSTLLAGVPSNAFTEALAFVFQARDLELLGLAKPDTESERMRVLNDFWATWEIAGVALVDTAVWHWMYDHPDATPEALRDATIEIAKTHWNQYYAPVLGGQDSVLLGVYSHMIAYPLYLPSYPLGHLIAFQIEEQVKKTGRLGDEFERMARYGSLVPDLWMENATGAPVGAGPLLRATAQALGEAAK